MDLLLELGSEKRQALGQPPLWKEAWSLLERASEEVVSQIALLPGNTWHQRAVLYCWCGGGGGDELEKWVTVLKQTGAFLYMRAEEAGGRMIQSRYRQFKNRMVSPPLPYLLHLSTSEAKKFTLVYLTPFSKECRHQRLTVERLKGRVGAEDLYQTQFREMTAFYSRRYLGGEDLWKCAYTMDPVLTPKKLGPLGGQLMEPAKFYNLLRRTFWPGILSIQIL
jgi:hypothetical protein